MTFGRLQLRCHQEVEAPQTDHPNGKVARGISPQSKRMSALGGKQTFDQHATNVSGVACLAASRKSRLL
jgi:hypothetical protein